MDTIDPAAFKAAVDYDRAAIIRLIEAHAADCERRGVRLMAAGYSALVSEIEDAMQHDSAHVEELERAGVQPVLACGGFTAAETALVAQSVRVGDRIGAIKAARSVRPGLCLVDCRDWVDAHWAELAAAL